MKYFKVKFTDPSEPDNSDSGIVSEQRAAQVFSESILAIIMQSNFYSMEVVTTEPSKLSITLADAPSKVSATRPAGQKITVGKKIKPKPIGRPEGPNDLKFVQGLGSKIQELLVLNNIRTFKELSKASQSRVKSVLEQAGPRFKNQDPKPLIEQAKLIKAEKWSELEALQAKLSEGRRKPGPKPGSTRKKSR